MRRFGLLAWPLWLCYFGLDLTVLARDGNEYDNVRLRVSLEKESLKQVSSSQHTFSQLEVSNLHPTESIMIHSIQTAPEETIMIRSVSGQGIGSTWDSIPQQFHVSRLPSGSLSLGPGQMAIVPLSFLPRYPDLGHDNHITVHEIRETPVLSTAARLDLIDLVGERVLESLETQKYYHDPPRSTRRRSNLHPSSLPTADEFKVTTSIIVDTSRGTIQIPITATSKRQNQYAIPDKIQFHHSSFRHYDGKAIAEDKHASPPSLASIAPDGTFLLHSIPFGQAHSKKGISIRSSRHPDHVRDCYDLYMSNPSPDTDLEITEVLVSRPDLMSVEFDPSKLLLPQNLMVIQSPPSHSIREWTEQGAMYLSPDSCDNYIATVCTAPNGVAKDPVSTSYLEEMADWLDLGSADLSLGFLQIRTDVDILFISLQSYATSKYSNQSTQTSDLIAQTNLSLTSFKSSSPEQLSLLKATPDKLEFRLVSSVNATSSMGITLQNKSPVPIRIMRVSLTMDGGDQDKDVMDEIQRLGLKIKVTQGDMVDSDEIPPASSVSNIVWVTCEANPPPSSAKSFYFHGTIVIRGTMDTELQYDEWKHETSRNLHRDSHVTLEIPYSISVLNGRIEVTLERSTHPYPQIFAAQPWDKSGRAVSTLFFPLAPFDALDNSEFPLPTQKYINSREIGHDLRIMSNMATPLSLHYAEIVDENGLSVQGTVSSPCSRFNVSRTRPFETNMAYPGFEDLGFLALHYRFDTKSDRQRRQAGSEKEANILPITCYLNIITSPADTGMHQVPLVVFPAELEITSPSHLGKRNIAQSSYQDMESPRPNKDQETVIGGYDNLLDWLRTSAVGQAFLHSLTSVLETRKQSTSQLFFKYVQKLLGLSDDAGLAGVKPLLLNIGAIEHGQIAKVPLVLTNHNPIPVTLSMDSDKVEGMTIELVRDVSQRRGGGNNIFDFLPKADETNADRPVISEGNFKGHPVYGLRQFLLSNRYSQDFSALFPLRDSVYQSQDAIDKHPLLQTLYQWHSYARFHRHSDDAMDDKIDSGSCDLSTQPPLFHAEEVGKDSAVPGPIMVSADKSLLRPLQVCSDRRTLNGPPGRTTIPPGGYARLEVRVRSPPIEYLSNDVSQVLSTGLVLSTTFGQLIPIFATFEALQGQLHLRKQYQSIGEFAEHPTTTNRNQSEGVIRVPLRLQWRSPIDNDDSFHGTSRDISRPTSVSTDSEIPLYVSSSFSRQVRLRDIQSCNPWFHVRLRNSSNGIDIATDTGTNIGSVHSTAFCHPTRGKALVYPSFYQCVLNWLTSRNELQPTGCGSVSTYPKRRRGDENGIDIQRGYRHIIKKFENVVADSIKKFTSHALPHTGSSAIENAFHYQQEGSSAIKSGAKKSFGYIDDTSLNVYAEAWDAWEIAEEIGLTRLSSNLRATIEYSPSNLTTDDGNQATESQSLTLSMHDLGIESTLSAPSLLAKSTSVHVPTTKQASILYFPATMVGSVAAMVIPLQNPTAVPVRVRLVAASTPTESLTTSAQKSTTDGFLQGLASPYVQNGSGRPLNDSSSDHLWWEGGGAFFLTDEEGNVIRSHHNISIRAGAGAQVSLVNPSLHSISAFVLGCAGRCGLRDEPKTNDDLFDVKHFSAIGASAAASITLVGRQRSPLPQLNDLSSDEPFVYSGGTPIPGNGRPQPFAIPFSSLDEIILPPYGTGEIGPILFRPPGRAVALGCDVAKHSNSGYWGVEAGKLCETEAFSSMILLENSLTGIERIEIRGKSLWEQLYFLDPPARDGGDAFGDIELRNGRTSLIFDGSGTSSPGLGDAVRVTPVIKQVVLHNGGDVTVAVESLYLSDTHKLEGKSSANVRSCRHGSFRLLDCWESDRGFYMVDGFPVKNVRSGFELKPGESRSLYIEHEAHCRKREEFVALNVDFVGQTRPTTQNSALIVHTSHDTIARRLNRRDGPFLTKKVELFLGYSMNSLQFAKCLPVNYWHADYVIVETSAGDNIKHNETRHRKLARNRLRGHLHWIAKYANLLLFTTLMAMISTMVVVFGQLRHQALEQNNGKARNSTRLDAKTGSEKKRASQQSLWNATFRCLARADPTSLELQALGREQIKQVVVCRYRAKGGSAPTSLFNAGVFIRERPGMIAPGGKGRQQAGKESSGGDRVRTLSEALLRTYSSEVGDSVRHLIPAGLGWRVAFANGIITEKSVQEITITKTTEQLFERRRRGSLSDHTPELVEGYESDSESFETEKNGDSKEEDKVEQLSSPSFNVIQKGTSDAKASDDTADDETNKAAHQWTKKEPKKVDKSQKQLSNEQPRQSKVNGTIKDIQPDSHAPTGLLVTTSEHGTASLPSIGRKEVVRSEKTALPSSETSPSVSRSGQVSTSSNELGQAEQQGEIRRNTMRPSWKLSHGSSQNESSKPELKSMSRDKNEASTQREVSSEGVAPAMVATQDISNLPMLPPGISPPPGLAPPPGFNRDFVQDVFASPTIDLSFSTSIDAAEGPSSAVLSEPTLNPDLGNLKNSSSCPTLAYPQDMDTELLFGSHLSQTPTYSVSGSFGFGANVSPPINQHEDEPTTNGDPLLEALLYDRDNSHNGFDVLDFLDSILDDGGASEQRDNEHNSPPSGLLMGTSGGFLTLNPWASENRSRASAYGIAFDDSQSDGDEPTHGQGIPLLTPAAFLLAGQDYEDGDDDERAFSFYARLRDEE